MSNHKNLGAVEKLMDGYNPYRQRQEETRGLIKKWEPTGLLEGLNTEQQTSGMAVLLENQARQLIDESSHTGTSANSEEWSGVALPLVRKIFGELAAQEFVSVQPMNLPSGLIFYLDFKYGTAQPGFGDGDQVFGITSGSGDPKQGLYGAGRSGYSINDHTSVSVSTDGPALARTGSVVWEDVDYEPDLSGAQAIADTALRDRAIQAGAFGGGREGVMAAEFDARNQMQRAGLQAQLLQQGFQQAQAAAAADLAARQGLGTYQTQLGQAGQAQTQAGLDAAAAAAREAQFEPFTRLGLVGQQLAQIQPGAFPTQTVGYAAPAAPASPLSTALGVGTGIASIGSKLGLFG